jgi:methylmalonyl-CoA mutase N-terminal domain/subunit
MRTSRLIELKCPGDSWKQYVSESRLQKAEALLEERKRRSQNLELLDCLQISDKGQIIARNEEIRRLTRMQSRRQTEQVVKMLESLRNNLAHSQDIVTCDWETIVELCKDMERVTSGTEEVQEVLGAAAPAEVSPPC